MDSRPVFAQIMEIIENDIMNETYKTDDLIISTTQIAKLYSVNPTTAVKAVGRLTDDGILYKKPGIGMCVSDGAREKIVKRRKVAFLGETIDELLEEARNLEISIEDLLNLIRERVQNHD